MKNKTLKTVMSLICAIVCSFGLIACGEHEHSFSTQWSKDGTNHWHVCTGEDCVEVSDKDSHNFVIKYSADYSKEWTECSVCGYKTQEATHNHTGGLATCTNKAICSACGQEYGEELGHNYGAPTYSWSADNSTCTATRICGNDATHTESESATITSQITQAQSTTQVELTTYTATFEKDWTETQTKSVQTKDVLGVAKVNGVGYPTFNEAITAAGTNGTIEILESGSYTMPGLNGINNPQGAKNLTFIGNENTVVNMQNGVTAAGCTVVFEGVTLQYSNANYKGLYHAEKEVYRNCKIIGKVFLYAPTAEFEDCIFENKDDYCVWTYGAINVSFTDCIFETGGKAILVYNEKTSANFVANITLSDCVFNDDDTLDTVKAVVETGSNATTESSNKYNLTFTNCIVNGFAENDEGIATNSKLWGNKNSMSTERLNVVIDGDDVY